MSRIKNNPLLASPPRQMHSLQGTGGQYFARVVGRRPTAEDYFGVHTTTDFTIAAAYAQGSSDQESDPEAFPVVISICVDGLTALPDVDSLVKAAEASMDRGYLGEDVYDEADSWNDYDDPDSNPIGQDPYYFYIDQSHRVNIANVFVNEFGDEAQEQWDEWKRTGMLPISVAIGITSQKRYATDIGLDRVVAIDSLKRVHREILEDYWDGEDDEKQKAKAIEDAGYIVVTMEDTIGDVPREVKRIYSKKSSCNNVEYHGTSSTRIAMAFPGIKLPPDPFPVTEIQEPDDE